MRADNVENSMPMTRRRLAALLPFAPAVYAQPQAEQPDLPTFRETVDIVVAPVTVTDGDGNYVAGLKPYQFHLTDNNKRQNIKVDETFQPLSVVIAIQANSSVEAVLPQIRKIGPLIEPLVIGEHGEAAVLAFDHQIRRLQEFTSDAQKITDAVKKIKPGSTSNAMTDAVMEAARMLRSRPQNRRRIMLLMAETRDRGSQGRVKDSLIAAQMANIIVYSINISRLITTLTAKAQPSRPDPLPPAMRPMPPNVPSTPNTVMQTYGAGGGQRVEFIPLMVEIFKDTKAIFVDNPIEVFTKGTGGTEFAFIKQRALEEAVSKIGEELHSQYLISYNPNNKDEGGFHQIRVGVEGRRDVNVRTRPGYWLAPK